VSQMIKEDEFQQNMNKGQLGAYVHYNAVPEMIPVYQIATPFATSLIAEQFQIATSYQYLIPSNLRGWMNSGGERLGEIIEVKSTSSRYLVNV